MKKLVLFFLCLLLVLTGCSGEDPKLSEFKAKLCANPWEVAAFGIQASEFTFKEDGTGTASFGMNRSSDFTYTLSDVTDDGAEAKIELIPSKNSETGTFIDSNTELTVKIDGDDLIFTKSDGQSLTFKNANKETSSSKSEETTTEDKMKNTTATIGDTQELDGISFKLDGGQLLTTGVDGSDYYKPPEGRINMLLNMTVTNNSDKGWSPNTGSYEIETMNTTVTGTSIGEDDWLASHTQELAPGESLSAPLSFQVPVDATDFYLQISTDMIPMDDSKKTGFKFSKDQLTQ